MKDPRTLGAGIILNALTWRVRYTSSSPELLMKSVILDTVKFRNLPTVWIVAINPSSRGLRKTKLTPDEMLRQGKRTENLLVALGKARRQLSEVKYFDN